MIGVVLFSKKLGINPDNVATPVAASLGDLTTLALLSLVGKLVFMVVEGKSGMCMSDCKILYLIVIWQNMVGRRFLRRHKFKVAITHGGYEMFYRKINRNSKRPISGIDGKKKSEFKNQLGIFSTVARKYWNR